MQDRTHSFGYWLRRRRKALDLTQKGLAQRVSCSGSAIRKIEADQRRPSRQLAQRLVSGLAIPADERDAFLAAARGRERPDSLRVDDSPAAGETRTIEAIAPLPAARESSDFVGRDAEFGLLIGLAARLTTGRGHVALIEGEPGIGKSRLMREVTQYARGKGWATLTANCYEIERSMPYQSVIELVTRALGLVSADALGALPPASLAELASLSPLVGERIAQLPRLSPDFPEARQARLARAVLQLLDACRGGRPIVVVVDDIHWADEASVRVLHYIARRAAEEPALVLYAYRDEALGSDELLASLVESLRREHHARSARLARFDAADTARLVAATRGDQSDVRELATRLHRESDGNPFFLVSILHALADGEIQLNSNEEGANDGGANDRKVPGMMPDTLRAAVRARIAHVPKEMRPLLDLAAVIGRRFDFDTLLGAAGVSQELALRCVELLASRRLLSEEPDAGVYDFTHDKVREVVYADIGGARLRLLHRAVADALERRVGRDSPEHHARLAGHFESAQLWSSALQHQLLAGERSQAMFAMTDALHWFDRAVALAQAHPGSLDPGAMLVLYGHRGATRAQVGQTAGAVDDFSRVIDAARARGDAEKVRDGLIELGMAHRRADAFEPATAALTDALAESRAMNDDGHVADTLYHLGTVAWSTGRNAQAIRYHAEAVEICERGQRADLVAVQAYHGRGEAHFANAEPAAAIECYTRSIELARKIGDRSYECENLMMIGHAYSGCKGLADYRKASGNLESALEIARSTDLQWHMGPILLGLDHVRACVGDYGTAWTGINHTLGWLEDLKLARYQLIAYDFIGHLLLDLELNEQAAQMMARGLALASDTGIMFFRAAIEAHDAIARARLGQREAGKALDAALERSDRNSERYMTTRCLEALAECAFVQGDTMRCRVFADELHALAAANGLRELQASAQRWRGESLLAEKNFPTAQVELAGAALIAEGVGRMRLRLDIETALVRLNAARRKPREATRHEDNAATIAAAMTASLESSGLEARLGAVGYAPAGGSRSHA